MIGKKFLNVRYSLLLVLPWLLVVPAVDAQSLPDFTSLVEESSAAVVNISTTQKVQSGIPGMPEGLEIPDLPEGHPLGELFRHFFGQGGDDQVERDAQSLGSGFIMSPDGYIMTNYHVVKGADEIIVRLVDRRELKAEIVGLDERSDIALVKVKADNLPVVRIGKSSDLKVGEWVLAIGSPFGFDHSATQGIVSAMGRNLPSENYVPFIQTDVAINPGNSGGPLFNLKGEVVGVNSQIYSRSGGYMGLSFAIPIEVAMDVANQLKSSGKVSRGWLGVLIQDVTLNLAESFGMKQPRGALVAQVMPDSPASKAGIQVGDVIVNFNGVEVANSSNLPPIVGSTKVGKKVPVRIIRNGKEMNVKVKLGELPDDVGEMRHTHSGPEMDRLGLSVLDLDEDQREELGIPQGGVLVQDVKSGTAADAGIEAGDVILNINNWPVKNVKHFNSLVEKLEPGSSIAVLVHREGSQTFLALKVPRGE